MKCLWLTRKFPRPGNSGELIYSDGLIRSFATTGVDLTVVAHDNDESPVGDGSASSEFVDAENVRWLLGTPTLGGRAASLLSRYPGDSWRLKNGGPEKLLRRELASTDWEAVIIDHAAIGWALDLLKRLTSSPGSTPFLVYVSHNHEARVRRAVARDAAGPLPKRLALRYDAEKYARQEESLCRSVDLVTAITETEVAAYRSQFPSQRYLCLTPGFGGREAERPPIGPQIPRRAVMSGSFEWIAKRMNLERFLSSAADRFSEEGIQLQVVGKTDESFRAEIATRFPAVDFVGRVPDMSPYLLDARIGLIVEELGGGFKLKSLDYIFHGLPLAGLEQAVDGLPLHSPENILLTPDVASLTSELVSLIDDFDRLNAMKDSALAICRNAFRWEDRDRRLLEAIESGKQVALSR